MSSDRSAPFGSVILGPEEQSPRRLRVRVQLLLTVLLVSTHVIGAAVVVAIAVVVLPTRRINDDSVLALAITVPAYVLLAVLLGTIWGTRSALRAARWALEDREPTAVERRRALRIPLRLTIIQGSLWLGGFLLFTAQALALQPARALGTGFAVAIAGMVVVGIAYLLSEFTLRPVSARALSAGPVDRHGVIGVQGRMLLFWGIGTASPVAGLGTAAIVALVSDDMSRQRLAIIALVLTAVVLLFGFFVTVLNARAVVAPIATVSSALERVGGGHLDAEVTVFDGTELGLLQAGFNDMARGLREREALRDMFGRHVGREVAEAAADRGVALGGETRTVSVLFIDLVGSTTYATERHAQEVVRALNRFFTIVVEEVDRHGGLVNKFMGDAALAIFNAPVDLPDHATAALRAARSIAARLDAEVSEIRAGIGVATGEAVAGNIGDESRFEYTVIGDSVNSASRLCDLSKQVPGRVLVAAESVRRAAADEQRHWRAGDEHVLRGRLEATPTAVLA